MTKRPHPGREPKTHFDQVPVDMVKKIVRRQKAARRSASLAVKPPAGRRQADAGHFRGAQFYKDPDALLVLSIAFVLFLWGMGQDVKAAENRSGAVMDLHPTPVEGFFNSAGIRIRYVEAGQGPPVVLIHGYIGTLTDTGSKPEYSRM